METYNKKNSKLTTRRIVLVCCHAIRYPVETQNIIGFVFAVKLYLKKIIFFDIYQSF